MIVGFFPATTMPDADWWQALWPDPAEASDVTAIVEPAGLLLNRAVELPLITMASSFEGGANE